MKHPETCLCGAKPMVGNPSDDCEDSRMYGCLSKHLIDDDGSESWELELYCYKALVLQALPFVYTYSTVFEDRRIPVNGSATKLAENIRKALGE